MQIGIGISLTGGLRNQGLQAQVLALAPDWMTIRGDPATNFVETTGASATTPVSDGSVCGTMKNLGTLGGYATAPSSSARPSVAIGAGAGNTYHSCDGVDDELRPADISITTAMTVIRSFRRASAGIVSGNFGCLTVSQTHDALWYSDNVIYAGLGTTEGIMATSQTQTGNFVFSSVRDASNEIVRRNGVQIGTRAAAVVGNTLNSLGKVPPAFNSGRVFCEALWTRKLNATELAIAEAWAASLAGVTL